MAAVLSFEQAPPISVPFRFFLTAPSFGVLAGLYLLWLGPAAFEARSTFPVLAMTHALTVGYLMQVMCGALMQLSPVAAGANVWRPWWTGSLLHLGLTLGGVCLVGGFALAAPGLFKAAAVVLGTSLGIFVVIMLVALVRTPARGPTVEALRFAVVGLGVTVVLGASMASVFGWGVALPVRLLLPIHAGWGLIGWSLVLVAGVSYLVVPMFQLTPSYPAVYARWLPRGLFAALALWSLLLAAGEDLAALRHPGGVAVLLLGVSYAAMTLRLQRKRRRKVADVTMLFFRAAMLCGLAAAALALLLPLAGETWRAPLESVTGIMLLAGFFVSVVDGMLYKIVPFIVWLNLQKVMPVPPNMNKVIPERQTRRQLWLHLAALAALLPAPLLPAAAYPAGLLFAASNAMLGWNLWCAMRLYRATLKAVTVAGS